MLNQIKLFLEKHLAITDSEDKKEEQLRLASVALFMEMLRIDDQYVPQERELILRLVQKNFSLNAEQASSLIESADQQSKQATDYFQFTSLINKQCTLDQKISLIESLWKIAYSDGMLDPEEEYLVRKIADLLHVPHIDFILAKNRINGTAF